MSNESPLFTCRLPTQDEMECRLRKVIIKAERTWGYFLLVVQQIRRRDSSLLRIFSFLFNAIYESVSNSFFFFLAIKSNTEVKLDQEFI